MVMMGIITFRWLIFDVCFRFFNTLVVRTRLMAFNVKFNFTLFIMYVEYRNLARTPMDHMKHRRPNSPGHSRAVPAYFIWSHHVRSAEVSDLELDGNWKLLNKERNARAMLSVSCQQLLWPPDECSLVPTLYYRFCNRLNLVTWKFTEESISMNSTHRSLVKTHRQNSQAREHLLRK